MRDISKTVHLDIIDGNDTCQYNTHPMFESILCIKDMRVRDLLFDAILKEEKDTRLWKHFAISPASL
jgi:hypothetical protein